MNFSNVQIFNIGIRSPVWASRRRDLKFQKLPFFEIIFEAFIAES